MRYTRQDLQDALRGTDYYFRTYSPGDDVTRYRFFKKVDDEEKSGYFGPENGIYTALGIREAYAFACGLERS